jgi:hypothetical protein
VATNAGASEGPSADLVAGSDVGIASADGSAPANLSAPGGRAALTSGDAAAAGMTIPAALHGRWGMAPDDCDSTSGHAKGLLVIDAQQLRFFESVARPARNVELSPDSLSADFAFTGEGTTWTRFVTLQLRDARLVRTESSPMASFTYVRCS